MEYYVPLKSSRADQFKFVGFGVFLQFYSFLSFPVNINATSALNLAKIVYSLCSFVPGEQGTGGTSSYFERRLPAEGSRG